MNNDAPLHHQVHFINGFHENDKRAIQPQRDLHVSVSHNVPDRQPAFLRRAADRRRQPSLRAAASAPSASAPSTPHQPPPPRMSAPSTPHLRVSPLHPARPPTSTSMTPAPNYTRKLSINPRKPASENDSNDGDEKYRMRLEDAHRAPSHRSHTKRSRPLAFCFLPVYYQQTKSLQ